MPMTPAFLSKSRGFTWIEMVIVLSVIGVLAIFAIPAIQDNILKRQVKEGLPLADVAKKGVQVAWVAAGAMPKDNKEAGAPAKEKIVGNFIKEVVVKDGAITLVYGNNASQVLHDKKLTMRPAVVKDTPATPIAWICAEVSVPKGMEVLGENETDIKAAWLPIECRGPETTK